jgi:K(+)-stimulated pyrophosphate-energized sodium pump
LAINKVRDPRTEQEDYGIPESQATLPPFSGVDVVLLIAVLACAVAGLGYGFIRRAQVPRADPGTPPMREVASAIHEGAVAYLQRQLRTMSWFIAAITIALWLLYRPIYAGHPELSIGIALAFLLGCACSYGAGYMGMSLTVQGNLRAAWAAGRGFRKAVDVAFRAGTVSGMFTVGLGLLGATLLFMIFREHAPACWWGSDLVGHSSRHSCGLAEASTRRRPMSARTSWVR